MFILISDVERDIVFSFKIIKKIYFMEVDT